MPSQQYDPDNLTPLVGDGKVHEYLENKLSPFQDEQRERLQAAFMEAFQSLYSRFEHLLVVDGRLVNISNCSRCC